MFYKTFTAAEFKALRAEAEKRNLAQPRDALGREHMAELIGCEPIDVVTAVNVVTDDWWREDYPDAPVSADTRYFIARQTPFTK